MADTRESEFYEAVKTINRAISFAKSRVCPNCKEQKPEEVLAHSRLCIKCGVRVYGWICSAGAATPATCNLDPASEGYNKTHTHIRCHCQDIVVSGKAYVNIK